MSGIGTAHHRNTREASAPATAEVASGLLTAPMSPLALDGSLAPARSLFPYRLALIRDAAPSPAASDRAYRTSPAGIPVAPARPTGLSSPNELPAPTVGCGDAATVIESTRHGEAGTACSLRAGASR